MLALRSSGPTRSSFLASPSRPFFLNRHQRLVSSIRSSDEEDAVASPATGSLLEVDKTNFW